MGFLQTNFTNQPPVWSATLRCSRSNFACCPRLSFLRRSGQRLMPSSAWGRNCAKIHVTARTPSVPSRAWDEPSYELPRIKPRAAASGATARTVAHANARPVAPARIILGWPNSLLTPRRSATPTNILTSYTRPPTGWQRNTTSSDFSPSQQGQNHCRTQNRGAVPQKTTSAHSRVLRSWGLALLR